MATPLLAGQRGGARGLFTGTVALLLCLVAPLWPTSAASTPEIWFGPKAGRGPVPGISDFSALFHADNAAWTSVEAKIGVYNISFDHMAQAPDEEILRIFSDLHSHHVKLAVTIGAVARLPGETCGVGEGYSWPASHQRFVEKLARLHLQPDVIMLDSPLGFGRYHPKKCQLTNAQLLQHLIPTVSIYAHAFPAATFGDIEAWIAELDHPDWREAFRAMKDGLAVATGVKLASVTADINEHGHANWAAELAAVPPFVHSLGMRYGVILDGRGREPTDEAWIASAKQRTLLMEDQLHIIPDYVVVASWNPHPTRALPSTDPASLSSLIDWYLKRTH